MNVDEILKKGKVVETPSSEGGSELDSILSKGKVLETKNVTEINKAQRFVDKASKKAEDTYGKDSLLYKATAPARLISKVGAFLFDNKKEIVEGTPKLIKNIAKTVTTKEGREQFSISLVDGGIPSIKNVVYNFNDLFYGGAQRVFEKMGAETLAGWVEQDKMSSRQQAKKASNEVKDFLQSYALTYDNVGDTRNFWERVTAEDGSEEVAKVAGMQLPTFLALLGVGVATRGANAPTIPAVLSTSFALNAGDAYQQGKDYLEEHNIPLDREWENKLSKVSTLVGVATAPLDAYGLDKIMKPSSFVSFKNILAKNVTNAILDTGVDMVAEAGTEGLQEIIQNAWAKTYNENQNLFEGVPEAMFGGGLFAGGSSTLVNATNIITGGQTAPVATAKPKETLQYAEGDISHSEAMNIDQAIAQDPSLSQMIYQNAETKVLTEKFAQGRLNDIAQKAEAYMDGLGEKVRSAVDVKNTTYDAMVQTALKIIEEATPKTGTQITPADFGGSASIVFNSAGLMASGIAKRLKEGVDPDTLVDNIVAGAKKAGVEFTEEQAKKAVADVKVGYDALVDNIVSRLNDGMSVNAIAKELTDNGSKTEEALALVERVSRETTSKKVTQETKPVEQKALGETTKALSEINESVLEKTPADLQAEFTKAQDNIDQKLTELNAKVNDIKKRLADAPDRSNLKKTLKIELSKAQQAVKQAEEEFNNDLIGNATAFREFLADYIPKNFDTKITTQQLNDIIDGIVIQATEPRALKRTFNRSIKSLITAQIAYTSSKTGGSEQVKETTAQKKERILREVNSAGEGMNLAELNKEIERETKEGLGFVSGLKLAELERKKKALEEQDKKEGKSQKEKVKEVIKKKGEASIKEIAKETKILEPNVRRILGVGAKDGTFERVDSGVYRLTIGDEEVAVILPADAVETLPKLAENGFKADMIFLDIPYKTSAITGGNRKRAYEFISVEDFGKVLDAVSKIARDNKAPVVHMFSQAPSGMKQMQKYNDLFVEKGFKPVGRGEYQKTYQDGKPVGFPARTGYKVTEPEGILVFTKSGELNKELQSLNFKMVRPKGYDTEKPAEMLKALIEMTTEEGDVVLDPFAGSGVAGAEAVKSKRKAVLLEKNKEVAEKVTKPRVEKAVEEAKKNTKTNNEYATGDKTFYHGTLSSFDSFDAKRKGENTQYENAKWGFFFISDKNRASQFVEDTRGAGDQRKANVMEVKLDIKNPIDLTIKGIVTKKEQASLIYEIMTGEKLPANEALKQLDEAIDLGTVGEFFDELYSNIDAKKKIEDAGYDGIVAEFGRDNGDIILEYVAFNPEQVKIKKEEKTVDTKKVSARLQKNAFYGGVMAGTYKGKPYATNTYILEFNVDMPHTDEVRKEAPNEEAIDTVVQRAQKDAIPMTVEEGKEYVSPLGQMSIGMVNTEGKKEVIQEVFYDYFTKKYSDVTFEASKDVFATPLIVKSGETMVGLIMPLGRDGYTEVNNNIEATDEVAVRNEDVGEKIGGSAKDKYQKQAEGYKETYTVEELKKLPLAKMLPPLDFKNLQENKVPDYLIQSYIYNKTRLGRRPTKGYKLDSWLRQVLVLRDLGNAMFKQDSADALRSVFMTIGRGNDEKTVPLDKLASEVPSIGLTFDLYEKYNYIEDNAIREFSVSSIREGKSGEGKVVKDYIIRRNEKYFASIIAESIEEFYKKFDEKYKDYLTRSTNKKPTGSTFQKYVGIYRERSSGNYLVMYKNGKREFILATYKTIDEAKTARNNEANIKSWEEKFNKATGFDENSFRAKELPTVGKRQYRTGDISAEQFMTTFGFRGVEFGNWLNQEDRRVRLNSAYDSFKDLAVILGVPDQALSLNGELGFAFGSRGKKGAMAHYEPMKVVINITKENGAGTIAHEWWHALDNYFSRKADNKLGYLTDMPRRYPRKELSDAVDNLIDTIYKSDVYKRSKVADRYKGRPYYTNHTELGARAFEIYVREKLASQNLKNGFLVQVPDIDLKGSIYEDIHPYAVGEEVPIITNAVDNVVKNLLVKKEGDKQVFYKTKNGETQLAGVEEAVNFLNDFKSRLNIDFDVNFVNAILASKEGVITKEAYGATLDNTIAIVKQMAKHTAEHEVVHLTLANMDKIPVFSKAEITRDAVLQAKADLMGIEYDEASAKKIEEALAMDFERFVEGKHTPKGIVRKFFVMLKNMLIRFARAIGLTGGDIVTDYYDILLEGQAIEQEMVRLENKGIVNAYTEEGVLDVSSIEDLYFKEKEEDAYLGKLKTQFNELVNKQDALEKDTISYKTDLDAEMIKKSQTARVVEATDQDIKDASRFTTRKDPRELTPRGEEFVESLEFENPEEAKNEIRDYLRRKTELVETRNKLRDLRNKIATTKKENKETKQALRDIERRLKLRKAMLERKDYYVGMGIKRGKKEQMSMIWKRGRAVKNAQDLFGISDNKAKTIINNRNIRLMSEQEFNDFLLEFANKAQELRGKLDAQDAVNALIQEKQLGKVDNLRKALGLPSIPNMSEVEAERFLDALSNYEFGDVFLTQRQIETIHRTNWGEIRTEREVLGKMQEKMGINPATLKELTAPTEGGKYASWIKLARKHPFYNWLIGKRVEATIKAEREYLGVEQDIDRLGKKARASRRALMSIKGKVVETLVPTDEIVFGWLESENKEQYAKDNKMTKEELDFATHLKAKYYGAWEYLSSEYGVEERRNYMTHIRRTFWEALKEDGIAGALRETFMSQKEEEAMFKILDEETGETIAFEKFFGYAMRRTGGLVPSKNVVRSSLAYFKALAKKKAMDEFVPEALIAVQAHKAVVGTTEKGLSKDPTFEKFVKKFLNDAKGRKIDFMTKQGSKLDIGLRAGLSWIAIKYLGFNVATAVANFIGDFTAIFWELSLREGLTGVARSFNIPKSSKINKEYRFFTGRNPFVEMFDAKYNMPQRLLKSVMVLMELALFQSNKFFLRAKMTDAEWQSGVVEDPRLKDIALSLSRAKPNAFYVNSLAGSTTAGRATTQFGSWAFPIFNSLTSDFMEVVKMLKTKKTWDALTSNEAQKVMKFIIMGGLAVFAIGLIEPPDEDDDSFKAQVLRKAQRELTTLFQALQFVTDPRNYALIIQEIGQISAMVQQLLSGEEYKTDGNGYGIGDKKWVNSLKRIVTPTIIRRAFPTEKENTKENLIQEAIKKDNFDPAEIVDFLYADEIKEKGADEVEDYRKKKEGEIKALYELRKNYTTPLADIIVSSKKNEDKVKEMIQYTKEVGVDKAYGEVKELYHDRNLCSDPKKKTGCLVSGQLFKDYQKAKNKLK